MILTDIYKIDGQPMVAPDENVEMSFADLDAAESGRDESGYMHRIVVRHKVGVWNFCYSHLSQEEYAYLLSILPQAGSFVFTRPRQDDCSQSEESRCYISGYSVAWRSRRTGDYRNLKFSIIEC